MAGNLTGIYYPDGKSVAYTYDEANRLTSVTDYAGRETTYEYDINGRLIYTMRPNGTHETRSYDPARRIGHKEDRIYGVIISMSSYGYDQNGNLEVEYIFPWITHSYGYDGLDRLTQGG